MKRIRALLILTVLGASGCRTVSDRPPGDADFTESTCAEKLLPPVRIKAAGKPIDTEFGHAAPWVCDFDGDGVNDLLVGQFGDGQLWTYRNEGSNAHPKLVAGTKFKRGSEDGRVPAG